MNGARRDLTLDDVTGVLALSAGAPPDRVYEAVSRLASEVVGIKMLTVLGFVEATKEVERLYSSNPETYPVGGRKRLSDINRDDTLAARGEVFLAADPEAVRRTFPDHELLLGLGIGSVLNAPIRHAARRLGTLNCCGTASGFGVRQIEAAKTLAHLLVPVLLVR
jgi:GAF domain-containing protein